MPCQRDMHTALHEEALLALGITRSSANKNGGATREWVVDSALHEEA